MNPSCQARLSRAVAWILIVAMLLPTVEGCATMQPSTVILDGIVVNGQRLARPDETGLVWVTRGNLPLQVHAGMELRTGDFVVTGPNAYAVIRYPSGSEMLLRPNSRGRIGSFSEFVGELFVKVKDLQNLKSFSPWKPRSSAPARGAPPSWCAPAPEGRRPSSCSTARS